MTTRTGNFAFELIDFNQIPWHLKEHDNWRLVDAIFAKFISITNIKGVWANALTIAVNDKYVDAEGGTIWTAKVAHTTAATGLFAADRTSNTTYWEAFALDATDGGTWAASTAYTANTFLVDSNRYGIVATSYTSSSSYDTDVTNGNIVTLIDISTAVTAAAASATQAAASAATNNLPTVEANKFLQANAGATGYDAKSASEVLTAIGAIVDLVSDTSPQLGGFLDTNAKSITFSQGAAVASVAGDTDIWAAADGNTIHITGTNAITDFGTPAKVGDFMWLIFDAAASVVDSATITVVGNTNFQAAANDLALVYALTTSTFLFIPFPNAGSYIPVNTINNTHLKDAFVGDHTEVTVAAGDSIIFGDVGDSGNTKRDTVQGILDLASGGKVLQVVEASQGSIDDTTSVTMADTNLTGAITPASTDNKVLVIVTTPFRVHRASGSTQVRLMSATLYRGDVATGTLMDKTTVGRQLASATTNSSSSHGQLCFVKLDSPSSTSEVTYTVGTAVEEATVNSGEINTPTYDSDGDGKILMMEIAG